MKVEAKQALSPPGRAHAGSSPTGQRLRRLSTNRPPDSPPLDRPHWPGSRSLQRRLTGGMPVSRRQWGWNLLYEEKKKKREMTRRKINPLTQRLTGPCGAARPTLLNRVRRARLCLRRQVSALAGVFVGKHAPAECENAPVAMAAAADAPAVGRPVCRTRHWSCWCRMGHAEVGARLPARASSTCGVVGETLSRCAVTMRPSAPGRLQGSRAAGEDRAYWGQAHTRAS